MSLAPEKRHGCHQYHIVDIDVTHGISLLPQDARAALNGIRSGSFCCEIHGVHGIWAGPRPGPGPAAPGPGPGPGPAQMPWTPLIFQQKVPEQIPFRAALASWGLREMPWVPSMSIICILIAPMAFFRCQGHAKGEWSNPGVNKLIC